MQILKLEFAGIGPFVGPHAIDVAALGASGLFLLEGPTGAGKTTIIDALVFALYGDVAGAASSKSRLVSTWLRGDTEPYVDLVIETGRGLLRVRRVPEHRRRKARGHGTTVGRASIKLWKLTSPDDEGVLLSTSHQDANEELRQAIGLSKEQFRQTVVLPQGDFATFLHAKPEERRGVLQDIFGTEFYERLARQLGELAAEFRRKRQDAHGAVERAAASFAAVAWTRPEQRAAFEAAGEGTQLPCEASVAQEPGPAQPADDGLLPGLGDPGGADAAGASGGELEPEPDGWGPRARARIGELTWAAAEADHAAAEATAVAEEAQRMLAEVRARNALIAERARLVQRQEALAEQALAMAELGERLDAAERAEHARPAVEAVARAQAALELAQADAARAVAAVAHSDDSDLTGELTVAELEVLGERARDARAGLADLVQKEAGLGPGAAQLKLLEAQLEKRRGQADETRRRIADDREKARAEAERLAELTQVAETMPDCVAAEAEARTRLAAVRRLAETSQRFVEAKAEEEGATARAVAASDEHRVARAAWLSGLAGTLAVELVKGQPCPVCGSAKHPAPASVPQGVPDRATVERLDAAAKRAGEEAAQAKAHTDALATQMGVQQEEVGELTLVEAEAGLEAAVAGRRAAQRATEGATRSRQLLEALVQGADARERRLAEVARQLAAEEGGLAERAERLQRDRELVAEGLAGHASVGERAAALAQRAERVKRLVGVRRAVEQAEAALVERVDERDLMLTEHGLSDADGVREALLPQPERERLRRRLTEHHAQVGGVAERLAEPRFAELADVAATDETPVVAAEATARAAHEEALKRKGSASERLRDAEQTAATLEARVAELAMVDAAAAPYIRMADLANAGCGNEANITLPTFVLLRRFEEVIDLANLRLDSMTAGRYALRRTDAREGRSHKLGLGLEVIDHASLDAARDPATLSGGETFQASLALALGLADAVTAEAGGVELNTLFVDEGFGSLDPEALDLVMNQLTALRDAGRCVGVVSHVVEMKQRIAERVTVIPQPDGTSVLTTTLDQPGALAV